MTLYSAMGGGGGDRCDLADMGHPTTAVGLDLPLSCRCYD